MNNSFPNRWSFNYLKFTKYVINIIAEPKYKYGQQEQVEVEVTGRLALQTSDHWAPGSNSAAGEIFSEPKRRFIAHSLSCSPFHPSEIAEILLKET